MATIFIPDKQKMIDAGYPAIAHVPVLFGERHERSGCYLNEHNRYLRERALVEWRPGGDNATLMGARGKKPHFPTATSMKDIAERLGNFDDWCVWAGKDWCTIRYAEDIIFGYQADMTSGRWSERGAPLASSTANVRVDEACNFLLWAAALGLREPFIIPVGTMLVKAENGNHSHGHEAKAVQCRTGKVRRDPKDLRLPTDEEIKEWAAEVVNRRGPTKALMCDLVLGVATRLEETVQWRVDTLPLNPRDWHIIDDHVRVELMYGAKGPKTAGPDGEEIGPKRRISIPLKLAMRLHNYRERARLTALAVWRKTHPGQPDPKQLFLSPETGGPITRERFYEAWHAMRHLPYEGWSPQLGRHWWACTTLLEHLRLQAEKTRALLERMPESWVDDSARSIIETVIRPQLGHVDSATTEIYLQWVHRAIALTDMYLDYHRSLEGDDDNG